MLAINKKARTRLIVYQDKMYRINPELDPIIH
jgi:hypothetical protein